MVIAAIRSVFSPSRKRAANELYIALVEQSRKPFFYIDCSVPDTLDGRFDVILLHMFLTLRYLAGKEEYKTLSRQLQEIMFDDMDRSLREMGVGDMGVGKRIRKMSEASFGRLKHYTENFGDDEKLKAALIRNIYRGNEPGAEALSKLLHYIRSYETILPEVSPV